MKTTNKLDEQHEEVLRCLMLALSKARVGSRRDRVEVIRTYAEGGYPEGGLSELTSRISSEMWQQAEDELSYCRSEGIKVCSLLNADYPSELRGLEEPPGVLYIRGELPKEKALAIVGSRQSSFYGSNIAKKVAEQVSAAGYTVISGLARGIDREAHLGSLVGPGKGVAVLGSGLQNVYPGENAELAEEIVRRGGAVISEYSLATPPFAYNFPERNRIVSALSQAILVVEARVKSGALITARLGAEQGKEVFAVPGSIGNDLSGGTNYLLKNGAAPFTEISDLYGLFPRLAQKSNEGPEQVPGKLSAKAKKLLDCLEYQQERDLDFLVEQSAINSHELCAILTDLELDGYVVKTGSGSYLKKSAS